MSPRYTPPINQSVIDDTRLAVVNIEDINIVLCVAPDEPYAKRFCNTANEDFTIPRYKVIPYKDVPNHRPAPLSRPELEIEAPDYSIEDYDVGMGTGRYSRAMKMIENRIPFNNGVNFERVTAKTRVQKYLDNLKKNDTVST
jgi:hypothetical protein